MKTLMKPFHLASMWGIDIFIHHSLFVFIGIFTLLHLLSFNLISALKISILFLFINVSLLVHEYAHCFVAKYFNIVVHSILLTPLGGLAKMEKITNPDIEIKIVLAGPIANLFVALFLLPFTYFCNLDFVKLIMQLNILIAFFNLIPAFPMDGGRMLRAYLSKKMSLLAATEKVVQIATIIAILMGIIGIFSNMALVFISIFIYVSGETERDRVFGESFL